jgi:hypothetical protein
LSRLLALVEPLHPIQRFADVARLILDCGTANETCKR